MTKFYPGIFELSQTCHPELVSGSHQEGKNETSVIGDWDLDIISQSIIV